MRVWIGAGKEDWRRPLPRPDIRALPDAITSAGFCFNGVFSLRYSVCGLIGSDVRPDWSRQMKRFNFR